MNVVKVDLAPKDDRVLFTVEDAVINVNGAEATPAFGIFFTDPGAAIEINAVCKDASNNIPNISIPIPLKMPLVRHASGAPTQDEIYLNATINEGLLNITGVIPSSGDWKILVSRINRALNEVNAPFKFHAPDVTFIA